MRVGPSCDSRLSIVPSAQLAVIPLLIIAARVSKRGEGRELQSGGRKPDRSTHASKRGGRGSGEREKCSVALLVFPRDGPRSAWAFQTSDAIR